MKRHIWIVPTVIAIALTGYLLLKPAFAPADPPEPIANTTPSTPAIPTTPELPISKIVLYSTGVGYFQRDGQVEGDARVDLSFPVNDINDLLKSLVLQDLDGGHVSAVGYDSHDTLQKTLQGFAINLGSNPSCADILNQTRGQKVRITATTCTLDGTIVGVESKAGAKDCPAVDVLNLWCADGLHSVPLTDVKGLKFQSGAVESEVQRDLEVLARGNDTKKAVTLHFNGKGQRKVSVGYVVETPLWRTSYRLLVAKDGKVFVQGWALVENPTGDDWKDVRMSLVSGRPISFKMDLYQPLYANRPVVGPNLPSHVQPVMHELNGLTNNSLAKEGRGFSTATNFNDTFGVQPIPRAPGSKSKEDLFVDGLDSYPGPYQSTVSIGNGVLAVATTNDLGDSFEYAISHPITIPRQKSALLPIVNKTLQGEKLSVYSASVHAKHPLLALRINTTGMFLMAGPVTVFETAGYAGDALLPDLKAGEERLVSYALDLDTEVSTAALNSVQEISSLKLHKGVLQSTGKAKQGLTYTLKNRGTHDRTVLVEHPLWPGAKLVCEQQPKEKTKNLYRFEVKVPAGKTVKLEVAQEQETKHTTQLHGGDVQTTRWLLKCELDNAQAKDGLSKLSEMQNKAAAMQLEMAKLTNQHNDITTDQARLRANLKEMPSSAAAYKRYLEKFDQQETTIEQLREKIRVLQTQHEKLILDCGTYLHGLEFETKVGKWIPPPPVMAVPVAQPSGGLGMPAPVGRPVCP